MSSGSSSSSSSSSSILQRLVFFLSQSSVAWIWCFGPALIYFLSTRIFLTTGIWVELGTVISSNVTVVVVGTEESSSCASIEPIFSVTTKCSSSSSTTTTTTTTKSLHLQSSLMNVQALVQQPQPQQPQNQHQSQSQNQHQSQSQSQPQQPDANERIIDLQWVYDNELGRGYILYSTTNNRIWRWEKGGGPIAIGRTLYMDQASCRSSSSTSTSTRTNNNTSGTNSICGSAMAIDFYNVQEQQVYGATANEGVLIIAEWGEERIVRMESETGARTPLILTVPDLCTNHHHNKKKFSNNNNKSNSNSNTMIRLQHQPEHLLVTPKGDLLVAIQQTCNTAKKRTTIGAIVKLKHAVHIPPLTSLRESFQAHSWTTLPEERRKQQQQQEPNVWYNEHGLLQSIHGMTITPLQESIYVSVQYQNGTVAIVELSLFEDDDDDDDDDDNNSKKTHDKCPPSQVILSTADTTTSSSLLPYSEITNAGDLVVSQAGILFWAPRNSPILYIVDTTTSTTTASSSFSKVIATLDAKSPITALELGTDGYLYIATLLHGLNRIRTTKQQQKPVAVSTNHIEKVPSSYYSNFAKQSEAEAAEAEATTKA